MPDASGTLSRRDFLKLGGVSLLSLFLPDIPIDPVFSELAPDQQGRVTDPTISVYAIPSYDGERVKIYWRDLVLPITGIAVSDNETAYNRVWYQIGDEGYAYSGGIQPVRTVTNEPVFNLPREGALGEVSVPFTDAHKEPDTLSEVTYRLYYETTHWVEAVVENTAEKRVWYRLYDDKFKTQYYAPAVHLRIISPEELAPISPDVPRGLKLIEVRLSQQLIVAYEYSQPVFATRAATGARFSTGTYTTPVGTYMTYYKRPTRHMAAGDLASNGYELPGVPWVLYITESGVSLHGTYWHNDFGRPRSHGCINLSPQAAKWLYRWTLPTVPFNKQFVYEDYGTYVQIIE